MTVHVRLHRDRGPAKQHDCVVCGEPAHHWAYTFTGRPQLYARDHLRQAYSPDLSAYEPLCATHHHAYDRGQLRHPALNDCRPTLMWCAHGLETPGGSEKSSPRV